MGKVELLFAAILVAVILLLTAYLVGWTRGYSASEGKWKLERAALVADAKTRAAQLQSEGNRLRAELEVARANVRIQYVEVVREVKRVASSTRRAINVDLAGLLNSMSGIRETTQRINPDGTLGPSREAPPDPPRPSGGTSERALGEWIANAVRSHEECRKQVDALIGYAKACSGQ